MKISSKIPTFLIFLPFLDNIQYFLCFPPIEGNHPSIDISIFFGMRSPGYDFFAILSNCDLSFRSGSFSHKHLHHSQVTPPQTSCLSTPSPPPPSRTPLTIPPPHLSTAVSRAWRSSVPAVEQRIAAGSNTQQARRAADGGGQRCGRRG